MKMGFTKLKLDMDFVKADARKTVYIVHLSYIFLHNYRNC